MLLNYFPEQGLIIALLKILATLTYLSFQNRLLQVRESGGGSWNCQLGKQWPLQSFRLGLRETSELFPLGTSAQRFAVFPAGFAST